MKRDRAGVSASFESLDHLAHRIGVSEPRTVRSDASYPERGERGLDDAVRARADFDCTVPVVRPGRLVRASCGTPSTGGSTTNGRCTWTTAAAASTRPSQIDDHAALLRDRVFGNPHSANPASLAATEQVKAARRQVLEFFGAPAEDYLCVFTANASSALKLVGESYPFAPGGTFALSADNHNSVNGMREFARRRRRDHRVPTDRAAGTAPRLPTVHASRAGRRRSGGEQPAGVPGAVQLLRRAAPARPRRRRPRPRLGCRGRRHRLRPDQPLRRRSGRCRTSWSCRSTRSSASRPASVAC